MSHGALYESVADAVAAGETVDWRAVERTAAETGDADLILQLKIIAAIGATRDVHGTRKPSWWSRFQRVSITVALTIAIGQVTLAILATPAALTEVFWPAIVNVVVFGVGGFVLLAGGGRDRRLPLLGGLFLTIGSAFVATSMPLPDNDLVRALTNLLHPFQPEAFVTLMLWRFVREFPADVQRPSARRVASALVDLSFAVGAALFLANAMGRLGPSTMPAWFAPLVEALDRNQPEQVYWPLLSALAAPAIPFLLWKSRFELHEDRRRVMFFVGALAIGLAPFVLAIVATPFVPALRDPALQQRVGVFLYGALALIVPVTAYSVAVDRVMDPQFLIRTARHYSLARIAVWAISLGPLVYLALDIHANRQLTIAEYLAQSHPAGPLALSAVGLLVLSFRQYVLQAIDRWFLLRPSDQAQTLARLERRYRTAKGLRSVTDALSEELDRAFHARSVAILLTNDDGSELVPVHGTTARLPGDSALIEILRSTRSEIQLDFHALGSIARLLPPTDRQWLEDESIHLLSPFVGSTGMVLGLVAVGESRTGLPYSTAHFALLTATSGQAAMQIENRWLRGRDADHYPQRSRFGSRGLHWQDEPAAYCPACSLAWSPETRSCSCGNATTEAALPLFVKGKFRLERQIGQGGMGVVYLAVDMALDRQVAIKTLPSLGPESAEGLYREAQTMAAILHPNLALIYGTEEWRGTPMLIGEYLAGGTLRDRIRREPMSYLAAIDLAIVLADVVDRVHASGVLHRDVKPSNIGYTGDGRPKLLDFGLARLGGTADHGVTSGPLSDRAVDAMAEAADPAATVTVGERLVGTPLYLAPEALAGGRPRPSFNLWALSMVLYEAIVGRHPFAAEDVATVLAATERGEVPDIRDYRPACPAALATFLHDALSPSIEPRPGSARAMRTTLRRLRRRIKSAR